VVFKFIFILNMKNSERGVTLVEIAVVIFIIAIFSSILIANFPAIQRQFALSRATYKLAQDLRKTEDLALSGVSIKDAQGEQIPVKGYGIFIDLNNSTKYVVYANVGAGDQKYVGFTNNPVFCSKEESILQDCVLDVIDLSKENIDLKIKSIFKKEGDYISSIAGDGVSINFRPPNPNTDITDNNDNIYTSVGIVLGLNSDNSSQREIWINKSGLVDVK
jgi:prepilin-type N-terminal cleavage/methylation domain-containing protein